MPYADNHFWAAFDAAQGSPASDRREAEADALIAADMAQVAKLRSILATARADIAALTFALGSPLPGWEVKDLLDTLDDFMPPPTPILQRRMAPIAADRVMS